MRKILTFISLVLVISSALYFSADKSKVFSGIPEEVPVYNEDAFFYSNLGTNEKKTYDLIMNSIYSFPEKIVVLPLSDAELDRVFEAILYDNTDVFFLGDTCVLRTVGFKNYFVPEYCITKSEYESKMSELEEYENEIVEEAMQLETDYDKEMFIHETVTKKCEYIDEVGGDYSSAYGCLINGSSSCEGYAKAMKRLFDKCGIESYFAIGKTENSEGVNEGHIWNIVNIDGEYYHIDATWDDAEIVKESKYTYFNLTDKEISKTHDVETRFLGNCNSDEQNYFVKNGIYFSEYDEECKNIISQKLASFADENLEQVAFRFSDKESYDAAYQDLFTDQNIYRVLLRANMESEKTIITNEVKYLPDDMHYIIRIVDYWE